MDYESLLIGSRMEAKGSLEIGVEKGRRCGRTCGREWESPLIEDSKRCAEMSTIWPPKWLLNEDFCERTDEAAQEERLLDATMVQNYYFGSAGFREASSFSNEQPPVGQQFSFFEHQWDEPIVCGTDPKKRN